MSLYHLVGGLALLFVGAAVTVLLEGITSVLVALPLVLLAGFAYGFGLISLVQAAIDVLE